MFFCYKAGHLRDPVSRVDERLEGGIDGHLVLGGLQIGDFLQHYGNGPYPCCIDEEESV